MNGNLHAIAPYPEAETISGLIVLRWNAMLFFANADLLFERVVGFVLDFPSPEKRILIASETITNIDITAADKLEELARISQAFPSRAGQESVNYESAQFLSGDGVLKHIEVDKNEQTHCLPAVGSRSRNRLEKCGLDIALKEINIELCFA